MRTSLGGAKVRLRRLLRPCSSAHLHSALLSMSGPAVAPRAAPESSQTEIVRNDSASSVPQTSSATARGMQILNLCRESNPSADELAQLLSDPSARAGINAQDSERRTPLIEGDVASAAFSATLVQIQVAAHSHFSHCARTHESAPPPHFLRRASGPCLHRYR